MKDGVARGKKAEYWNLQGKLVSISDFPDMGGYLNKTSYQLPNYNKKSPKDIALLPCDTAIHFTDSRGFAGIWNDNCINAGRKVNGIKFSWFSLIPEVDGLAGKLSPGVCPDKSRYGRFMMSIDITSLLSMFTNPVVKILGTDVYQHEVMYALVLCEGDDNRFTDFPTCPDENVADSSISFTSESKFLWSPFTMYDVNNNPWDHLALGIPHDIDVTGIGRWEPCDALSPSYSTETKNDAAAAIKVTKLRSVLSDLPNFAEESITGLSAKVAAIDLDVLLQTISDLKAALA
jgi:hypothetical protein